MCNSSPAKRNAKIEEKLRECGKRLSISLSFASVSPPSLSASTHPPRDGLLRPELLVHGQLPGRLVGREVRVLAGAEEGPLLLCLGPAGPPPSYPQRVADGSHGVGPVGEKKRAAGRKLLARNHESETIDCTFCRQWRHSSTIIIFYQSFLYRKQVVFVVLAQKKAIFRAGHLCFLYWKQISRNKPKISQVPSSGFRLDHIAGAIPWHNAKEVAGAIGTATLKHRRHLVPLQVLKQEVTESRIGKFASIVSVGPYERANWWWSPQKKPLVNFLTSQVMSLTREINSATLCLSIP